MYLNARKMFLPYGVLCGVLVALVGCSSPFQRETPRIQQLLITCFDQGDKYGEAYQQAKDRVAPSGSSGIFSQENLLAGMSRQDSKEASCKFEKEVVGKGPKCEQACRYGFVFPHSYRGGMKLDELWTEKDFQLLMRQPGAR